MEALLPSLLAHSALARQALWFELVELVATGASGPPPLFTSCRRGYEDPFCIRWVVPLGGLHPPAEVNLPYLATIGDMDPAPPTVAAPPGAVDSRAPSVGALAAAPAPAAAGCGAGGEGSSSLAAGHCTTGPAAGSSWHPAAELTSRLLTPPPATAAATATAATAAAGAGNAGDGTPGGAPIGLCVWNFAYGANMSPTKLGGARGLHPLRSLPACLPGWRLRFTHRGAMGNLVPVGEAGAPPSPVGDAEVAREAASARAADVAEDGPAGAAPHATAFMADSAAQKGVPSVVHGVLHLLRPEEYAQLACMEHEYRWVGWGMVVWCGGWGMGCIGGPMRQGNRGRWEQRRCAARYVWAEMRC